METTRVMYNLNLHQKLAALLCQIPFNLASAATAEAIRCGFLLNRYHPRKRLPKNTENCPSLFTFWPFMLISALMLFLPLVMTLLFSMLTLFYAVHEH